MSDTRSRILNAALDCFRERGYEATAMAEIARRAGVSPGTLYLHFRGKRELFEALGRPDLDFPPPRLKERRRELLDAAIEVFSQKGYAAATMDDVARAAGLTKGALYAYFPGKRQLFAAVLDNVPAAWHPAALLGAAPPAGDPACVLRMVALGYLMMFRATARVNLLRIILAEGGRDPEVAAIFESGVVEPGSALLAGYLQRQGYGPAGELQACIQAFMGMLFAFVVRRRVLAGGPAVTEQEEEAMADRAVRLLLYGLQKA